MTLSRKAVFLTVILTFYLHPPASALMAHGDSEILESIFEDHGAIMLLIDPETGVIKGANASARRFYGYSSFAGKKITDLNMLTPEEIRNEMRLAREMQKNYFVFPHRRSDGSVRTVEVYSWPVKFRGQTMLFSVIHDITEKVEAQKKVLKYQERLEELVKERTKQLEHTILIFMAAAAILIAIETITILKLIRNIRMRRKIQEELNETLISLNERINEAVEKVRSQEKVIAEQNRRQSVMNLLVNLAHQWRQPLNTIGLMIQNIVPDSRSEPVMKEIRSLSDTITMFTELYQENTEKESVNISGAFSTAAGLLKNRIQFSENPPEIINQISPDLNLKVVRTHIIEIFIQLMDNSMNIAESRGHTKPVRINVSSEKTKENITITYTDNCGGFEPEILRNLFSPYNTSGFRSRNKGLGLFQIQQILSEYYNGYIRADNAGEGAVILLVFPAETETA